MCMFSGPVEKVQKTCIYVAPDTTGEKRLVIYSNTVNSESANLMILPVPGARAETDVEFIDMSGQRDSHFFDVLSGHFPRPIPEGSGGAMRGGSSSGQAAMARLHSVGIFDASYASTLAHLRNLDPRLGKVSEELLVSLERHYGDEPFGFVVSRIRASDGYDVKYHPLAYVYTVAPEHREESFVPTRHLHLKGHAAGHSDDEDATAHDWSHEIYWPNSGLLRSRAGDEKMGMTRTVDKRPGVNWRNGKQYTLPPDVPEPEAFAGPAVFTLNQVKIEGTAPNDDLRVILGAA